MIGFIGRERYKLLASNQMVQNFDTKDIEKDKERMLLYSDYFRKILINKQIKIDNKMKPDSRDKIIKNFFDIKPNDTQNSKQIFSQDTQRLKQIFIINNYLDIGLNENNIGTIKTTIEPHKRYLFSNLDDFILINLKSFDDANHNNYCEKIKDNLSTPEKMKKALSIINEKIFGDKNERKINILREHIETLEKDLDFIIYIRNNPNKIESLIIKINNLFNIEIDSPYQFIQRDDIHQVNSPIVMRSLDQNKKDSYEPGTEQFLDEKQYEYDNNENIPQQSFSRQAESMTNTESNEINYDNLYRFLEDLSYCFPEDIFNSIHKSISNQENKQNIFFRLFENIDNYIKQLQYDKENLNTQLEQITNENVALQQEFQDHINESKIDKEKLNFQLQEIKNENVELKEEIQNLNINLERAKTSSRMSVNENDEKNNELLNNIEILKKELNFVKNVNEELQNENEELKNKNEELQKTNEELSTLIKQSPTRSKSTAQKLYRLNTENNPIKEEEETFKQTSFLSPKIGVQDSKHITFIQQTKQQLKFVKESSNTTTSNQLLQTQHMQFQDGISPKKATEGKSSKKETKIVPRYTPTNYKK